jgi:hypothetical protein
MGVSVAAYLAKRPVPMLAVPVRIVRTLLRRRSVPAPWIYLAALAIGTAFGLALDAWRGWAWWLVALVVVASVWLAFLLSGFMGPARGDSLGAELLDAMHPQGAPQRRWNRAARLIRAMPFQIYGLDASWIGLRMLGGYGMQGGKLSRVELTHGDPTNGPWVRIESARPAAGPGNLQDVARQLRHRVERPVKRDWASVSIPVEGERTRFDWLDERSDWAARGFVGDALITLWAHRVPVETISIVRVTDVEPYIEGWRRFEEQERRLHGE